MKLERRENLEDCKVALHFPSQQSPTHIVAVDEGQGLNAKREFESKH